MVLACKPSPTTFDLADRDTYSLVRRMYYGRFSRRVEATGMDPDDGFQEILLGLLRRQTGRSAFDARRSSLSHYLFVAMSGMTANLADKVRRRRRREGLGGASDAASSHDAAGVEVPGRRELEDLAAEMEIPVSILEALAAGEDPVLSGIEAGLAPEDAVAFSEALGCR